MSDKEPTVLDYVVLFMAVLGAALLMLILIVSG